MKKLSFNLSVYLLTVIIVISCCVNVNAVSKKTYRDCIVGSVTEEMTDPDYWNGTDEVIMNASEIKIYNKELIENKETKMFDLLSDNKKITAKKVKKLIDAYSIYDTDKYYGKNKITKKQKNNLEKSKNIDVLKSGKITIQYGVITEPVNVRSFPNAKAITEDGVTKGANCFDDAQLTRFRLGEGVFIYHESLKKDYYFVQGRNYNGWIKKSSVGLCNKKDLNDYLNNKSFIVTTERKITVINKKEMNISLGTKFNLDSNKKINIPIRKNNGKLSFKKVNNIKINYNKGYLNYTTKNLYKTALSLLGDRFDYGGRDGYYDSSDFINAVYSVFGIYLPRDTAELAKIKRERVNINKKNYNKNLIPGAALLIKGHVMIYLGTIDGKDYVMQSIAGYKNKDKNIVNTGKIVLLSINDIYLSVKDDITYKDAIICAVNIK